MALLAQRWLKLSLHAAFGAFVGLLFQGLAAQAERGKITAAMPERPRARFATVDAYIAAADPQVRATLQAIRSTVVQAVPGATECISYQMPALRMGRVFLYFAAFKKHVGLYPPLQDPALQAELVPYRGPRGNLQFPLDAPMPLALIARVAGGLARQYSPPA